MTHPATLLTLVCIAALGCSKPEPSAKPPNGENRPHEPAPVDAWGLSEAQRAEVLLRVGDDTMTLGYFVDTMGPDLRRWREVNGARSANHKIDETVDGHLVNMLLAKPAVAAGYDRVPEVAQRRKQRMVEMLTKAVVDEQGQAFQRVTDEDRRRYHSAHRDEFTTPAALRIAHIQCDTRTEAEQILARLLDATDPAAVIAEIGVMRVQNLGMFPVDESLPVEPPTSAPQPPVAPALRSAANTLEKNGEFYPKVLASPQGFHILKRTGHRDEHTKAADQLKATLSRAVLAERRQKLLDDLVAELETKAAVAYHPQHLEQVHVPADLQ